MKRVGKLFWATVTRVFVVVLLTAILLLPTAVTAMSAEQRRLFDLGIPYYDIDEGGDIDDCVDPSGGNNYSTGTTGSCAALAQARQKAWDADVNKNEDNFFIRVACEAGNNFTIVKAEIESILNRHAVSGDGKHVGKFVTDVNPNATATYGYYGTCTSHLSNAKNIYNNNKAKFKSILQEVLAGSNIARYATGNGSGGIMSNGKPEDGGRVVCVIKVNGAGCEDIDYEAWGKNKGCIGILGSSHTGRTAECFLIEDNSSHESWVTKMKDACKSNDGGGGNSSSDMPGVNLNNAETIFKFLTNKGFTAVQTAGIMGVWYGESHMNPTVENSSSGAYGIAQWLGDRKTNLTKKANYNTLEVQLNFFLEELNGSYKNRAITSKNGAQPDVPSAARDKLPSNSGQKFWDTFKNTSDLGTAVILFFDVYECGLSSAACSRQFYYNTGPSNTQWALLGGRLGMAQRVFNYFKNRGDITTPGSNDVDLGDYDANEDGGGENINCEDRTDSSGGGGGGSGYIDDGFKIFDQRDPAWGSFVYGSCKQSDGTWSNRTINTSGCGPTAMATAITALTGTEVTPKETTAYAKSKGMYICGVGSSSNVARVVGEHWGLTVTHVKPRSISVVNDLLRQGKIIITSGTGAAPFTSSGHYILIRGITDDGKWLIADSNGSKGVENSKKAWDPSVIAANWSTAGTTYALSK